MARKTIGVLLDHMNFFAGGYEEQVRCALDRHCREMDLDLLLIYGAAAEDPRPWATSHNRLFDLVHRDRVDALIAVSSVLVAFCGPARLATYLQRFRPMPLCSLGLALPGVPSVVVDNRAGMRSVVEHLIDEHGCRRLAFLSGAPASPEAQVRLEVCRQVVAERGLTWDPRLERSGDFMSAGGYDALRHILAQGTEPDAVVAANDNMALGAIRLLRERGYLVPMDKAVTGFDDIRLARLGNPPLTTVAQPIDSMTRRAIELALECSAGRVVPEVTEIPTQLVVRRSCGCGRATPRVAAHAPSYVGGPAKYLVGHAGRIRAAVVQALGLGWANAHVIAEQLVGALAGEVEGRPACFLGAVEACHAVAADAADRHHGLQNAVEWLRDDLREVSDRALDAVFFDALSAIARANLTSQVNHQLRLDENYLSLLMSGERITVVLDHVTLRSALHGSLPAAGFRNVMISRFPGDDRAQLEPYVVLRDGAPFEVPSEAFAARYLFPPATKPVSRHTLSVFPLAYETRLVGIAAFEYVPDTFGYHGIRDQIAAALRTIDLHHELLKHTVEHQQKRLESLSVLAGGVAHDLNNALGPLVALPEVILAEFDKLPEVASELAEARADIITIQQATLRASQSIRDLLTIGRQGRTDRQPLDLNQTVVQCFDTAFVRSLAEMNPQVRVDYELSPARLVTRGAEPQLLRVIANLVRNAVEASTGPGRVCLKLYAMQIIERVAGYELIDPGSYAVLEVTDSGAGIPAAHLRMVFDPFFTRKRAGTQSGTGLGLAIVHSVVKEHGGFVDVSSQVGKGSTFKIYLPRVDDSIRPVKYSIAPVQRRRARILVVDDDPVQLRSARRVLTQLGYEVETTNSGRHAVELFSAAVESGRAPYDLVLLDMLLGEEQDGLEVFESIDRAFPGQRAIVVSGHAATDRIELAVAQGLGWLAKPYTGESLARAVKAALP